MERPNKKDYLTTNQFDYQESLNKYYELLEMYIDVLENRLTLSDSKNQREQLITFLMKVGDCYDMDQREKAEICVDEILNR